MSHSPVYKHLIKKRDIIERIRIVGPMINRAEVFDALDKDGFTIVMSGPILQKINVPRVDPAQFLFVAERTVPLELKDVA